jgi:glucarate dehydratase
MSMLAKIPQLSDAHYHHLQDDIIHGGRFEYEDGSIKVPDGPGLGVSLDRHKLDEYAQLYKELGGYPYDRDPGYPGRYSLVPKQRFADPKASVRPDLPVIRDVRPQDYLQKAENTGQDRTG